MVIADGDIAGSFLTCASKAMPNCRIRGVTAIGASVKRAGGAGRVRAAQGPDTAGRPNAPER